MVMNRRRRERRALHPISFLRRRKFLENESLWRQETNEKKSHSHILELLFGLITRLLSGSAFLMRWPAGRSIETKGVNDLEEERSNMLTQNHEHELITSHRRLLWPKAAKLHRVMGKYQIKAEGYFSGVSLYIFPTGYERRRTSELSSVADTFNFHGNLSKEAKGVVNIPRFSLMLPNWIWEAYEESKVTRSITKT